jgi:hypothetical protein
MSLPSYYDIHIPIKQKNFMLAVVCEGVMEKYIMADVPKCISK